MKIVFAISEVEELVKTGGLADVGKALPLALHKLGHDVSIIMPYYQSIAEQFELADACPQQSLFTETKVYHFAIKQLDWHGINVFFIDYPEYFYRHPIYGNNQQGIDDNGERFSFLSGATMTAMHALDLEADIVHCHDWHTSLLPFLIKHDTSGFFSRTKTVFTIHNAAFQGVHPVSQIPSLRHHPAVDKLTHGGYINLLQTGIQFADKITTVSPTYARELLTDLGSHGLHDRLVDRQYDLLGILNGCDYSQWDPSTDALLPANFSLQDMSGKAACKAALQRSVALPETANTPLFGMVCRLTEQKGFGYLLPILDQLMAHNIQMVIIGTGEPAICMDLNEYAENHREQFAFINGFDVKIAHLIEAGSDFFLMPSQFEPCGLNQMYSLAYGTPPIVRGVGGLKDTVVDQQEDPDNATGFVFHEPSADALLATIRRALLFYYEHPQQFSQLRDRGMETRFTWHESALSYAALYADIQG